MKYTLVKSKKTHEEYLYIAPEGELTEESCRQLLKEINKECNKHGYERIMLNLSALEQPLSVALVYRTVTNPEAIDLLPFRLAWVSDDPDWDKQWKSLELIMRNRSLPWRSFSDLVSAEQWLIRDRRALHKK